MKYRRVYINGGTYFFTLVTFQRLPIYSSQSPIDLFYDAIRYTTARLSFEIVAFVILPDHIHYLWTLLEGSSDFSTRWRLVKSYFTRKYSQHEAASVSVSKKEKNEQEV